MEGIIKRLDDQQIQNVRGCSCHNEPIEAKKKEEPIES